MTNSTPNCPSSAASSAKVDILSTVAGTAAEPGHRPVFPSFATWLSNARPQLIETILSLRPDTVSPPPKSTEVLAARLQLRASVLRAVPTLGVLPLAVVEVAVELGADVEPVAVQDIVKQLKAVLSAANVPTREHPTAMHIRVALDQLRERGLVYGDGPGSYGQFNGKTQRKQRNSFEDYVKLIDELPSALPPGWQLLPHPNQPSIEELQDAISKVDATQRRLLTTLVHAGGVGSTKDAAADADPSLPVPRLINSHLLDRIDNATVRLPARVRALLRGVPLPQVQHSLRPRAAEFERVRKADERAAAQAWETVRRIANLLEHLGQFPAPTLKDGTIGVRETRVLRESLGLSDAELAETFAFASAAQLMHVGMPHPLPEDDNGGDYLAPTQKADEFLHQPVSGRWRILAMGLLTSDNAPWLIGTHSDEGKRIALLSPRAHLTSMPRLRALVLRCLADAQPRGFENSGKATAAKTEENSIIVNFLQYFTHYFPVLATRTSPAVLDGVVAQLNQLGLVTASGSALEKTMALGITAAGRALVNCAIAGDTSQTDFQSCLGKLLPPTTDQFMAQADNTIVVPGPATPELETFLSSVAILESPGLASVYRITEDSLSDALSSSWSAEEIRTFLSDHSLGDVPQSITYLLDDVARQHGRLRAGPAASFIRSDDAALLASLLSAPVSAKLGLRRLADTVLISQASLNEVIEHTRAAGFSLTAEDALGAALDLQPAPCRINSLPPLPASVSGFNAVLVGRDSKRVSAAMEAMAAGDRAAADDPDFTVNVNDDRTSGAAAYALLQKAARTGRDVTISFVDRNGKTGRRNVRPVTVSAGQVDAIDPASGQVLRILLHRITEVSMSN